MCVCVCDRTQFTSWLIQCNGCHWSFKCNNDAHFTFAIRMSPENRKQTVYLFLSFVFWKEIKFFSWKKQFEINFDADLFNRNSNRWTLLCQILNKYYDSERCVSGFANPLIRNTHKKKNNDQNLSTSLCSGSMFSTHVQHII